MEERFELQSQTLEGSRCWMTMLAEEEYRYKDKETGKIIHIYINFKCNRSCHNIFDGKKIKIFRLKAHDLYTPDVEKCKVDLVYDLQRNDEFNNDFDDLKTIIEGDILDYLF